MESLKSTVPQELPSSLNAFGHWKIASPWLRLCAQAIDQGLVAIVTVVALVLWFPGQAGRPNWFVAAFFLWVLTSILTQGFFIWIYKNTPGKKIFNLSIQSARPQHDITFFQAVVRAMVWWLGLFSLGAGWITVLSRPDRRAWHDLVADTTVISFEGDHAFSTPLEKRMGETWLGLAAFFFISILALIFTYEFGRLKGTLLRIRPPQEQQALERESWLLLAGGPSFAAMEGPMDDVDAPLKELMLLFSRARLLSPGQRFEFYHLNMQRAEDGLCPKGYEQTTACESARAMSQLLSVDRQKTLHVHALPGLQAFEQMESFENVSDQIHFLTEKTLQVGPGSMEYLALRIARARLLMKSGSFHAAKEALDDEIKYFHGKPVQPEDRFFEKTLNEVSCEAQALDDCHFDPAGACATDPYWQNWASGCQLQKTPAKYSSGAQALGFWWKQSHKDGTFDNLSNWQEVKKQFETDNARDFEKYVFRALDLVLTAKATHPGDLMGLVPQISPESPLWGWAHLQLLKQFGPQWAYLVPPGDQSLLKRFELTTALPERAVASDPSNSNNPREPAEKTPDMMPTE